jgi:hypothetical protein
MSKITFAAVAVLMATGTAFAGSDHHDGGGSNHYGSDDWQQPVVKTTTTTASIRKPVQQAQPVPEPVRPGSDRHRFGNH